jgi:hypothetical protein
MRLSVRSERSLLAIGEVMDKNQLTQETNRRCGFGTEPISGSQDAYRVDYETGEKRMLTSAEANVWAFVYEMLENDVRQ